ncbi:EF-hand calcium-binding domain-containing protein 7-like [Ptychodera flava]|uniref:EF-hand calcium-binding domain-containing protein 7-like n=1 Tax=Ptychodera flava TaxID=63121 RepID=UPI00396A2FC8
MSRKSSRSSLGSQRSAGSAGESQRSKDAEFYTECRTAYLAVFESASDPITSKEELLSALHQAGRNPSNRAINRYWTPDTIELTYDDFCEIMKKEKPTAETDLIKAFKKIDANGDGYISHSELYKVLTERGEKMTRAEVRAMIDEADDDGDGRLDYNEFCKMLLSTTDKVKQAAREKVNRSEKPKKASRTTMLSESSPKPSPRIPRKRGDSDDDVDSSKSRRESLKSQPPVVKTAAKSQEPRNLRNWHHVHSKGSFHFEEHESGDVSIVSHQYSLEVPSATSVWITIEPVKPRDDDVSSLDDSSLSDSTKPIDTALYILKEDGDEATDFVAFTNTRHQKKYTLQCDLRSGSYRLIPFTTGCRFKQRKSAPRKETTLVKKDKDSDEYVLTKQFRNALSEMFDMVDLDGNGALSREEFDIFQFRTSGEHCDDDAWEVVEENFELKNKEITKKGFYDLHKMEANENEGDTEELWTTLSSMGFSKDLTLDEACSFELHVHTENARVKLKALEIQDYGTALQNAICDSVIKNGSESLIKGKKDLILYTYIGDVRASVVVDNKSHSKVKVRLDCSQSKNCSSHRGSLDFTVDVPAKSNKVGHHLLPLNERLEWSVRCNETIMK